MKHLLSFVPTVKFRVGSSFMFQTTITLLYAVPILMALIMTDRYLRIDGLINRLNFVAGHIEKKQVDFQKKLGEQRIDMQQYHRIDGQVNSYFRTLAGLSFPWTGFFESLERILPAGVRLTRVRILPEAVIRIAIEGEATDLEQITSLLRSLFSLEHFSKPRLTRHSRKKDPKDPVLAFSLDVEYLPMREVQP